jgi:hypothetical protein
VLVHSSFWFSVSPSIRMSGVLSLKIIADKETDAPITITNRGQHLKQGATGSVED